MHKSLGGPLESLNKSELVKKAKELFSKNEYKNAKAILNELIEDPSTSETLLVECFFYLANIFHIQGEIGKAIKAFSKVLELEPGHTDASISLSVLYNDIGHYEDAKKVFDKADKRVKQSGLEGGVDDVHINKKFSLKHLELADMYSSYNRYDEALFEYNKVIALDSGNLSARIKVAKVYAKKSFMAKAFDELKKLKNEHPSFVDGRVALGVLFYGTGKILEAQNEWENVIVRDPSNSEAAMYLNLSKAATETTLP